MDDVLHIYRSIILLSAVGLAVSTAEYWTIARCFKPDGVYSWDILRLQFGVPLLPGINAFHVTGVRLLLVARGLALALVLLMPLRGVWFSVGLGILIVAGLVLNWRTGFAEDGSDRMNTIVLITLFLAAGPQSTFFRLRIGLWFLALEACLSYMTSGLAKLGSPSWRRGDAIYRILSTETYGRPALAGPLERRRWLRLLCSWSVMLLEALFPLALVLPGPYVWIVLGWGALFHLVCAVVMGFNSFLWAFVATYPAIVYVSAAVGSARLR